MSRKSHLDILLISKLKSHIYLFLAEIKLFDIEIDDRLKIRHVSYMIGYLFFFINDISVIHLFFAMCEFKIYKNICKKCTLICEITDELKCIDK